MGTLDRLLRPKSIAIIGGGAWCEAVVEQCLKIGFDGPIWPVHPKRTEIAGKRAFQKLSDLPYPPDASFIGVNRHATIEVVSELNAMGGGGAVCFASGFSETQDGAELSDQLLQAASGFPILGPNCYGALNALDGVTLWPDQHGLRPVGSGVAIVAQSSNISVNMTMQQRGLPIAYVITVGNQIQQSLATIGLELVNDPRVTALGLYIESFGDIRAFEALAETAAKNNKPVVVLKVGQSEEAQQATISHTASLAGSSAGADALIARLGFASVKSIATFMETLKVFHVNGPLSGRKIASLSCSGGEASVIADTAFAKGLSFAPLEPNQKDRLGKRLSSMVRLANPLDYHTQIWRDREAMTEVFEAMCGAHIDITLIILDFPRDDTCDAKDWDIAIAAIEDAARRAQTPIAVVASLPENMPEHQAIRFIENGVIPLCDLDHACEAIDAAALPERQAQQPVILPKKPAITTVLEEFDAKHELQSFGVSVPRLLRVKNTKEAVSRALEIGFPVVVKGEGAAHKSEEGLVAVNLANEDDVVAAIGTMQTRSFLIEEMVGNAVCELLVGVVCDPAHGYVLTLAAGGTMAELLEDKQSLLLPVTSSDVDDALSRLKISRLIDGYRGKPSADRATIISAVMSIQRFIQANVGKVMEVEINPLIVTKNAAIAADALIIKGENDDKPD